MLLRPSDDELQTPERINRENEDFKYAGAILHLDPSNEVEDSWSRDTEYKPKLTTLDGTYRQLIASNLAHGWPSSGMYLRKLIYKGSGIFSSPGLITRYTGSVGASLAVWAISGLLALMGARYAGFYLPYISAYAELAAAIPLNGGSQAYLQVRIAY